MRVLNLYAGIGGNRKLWEGVEVTAVEMDVNRASVYQDNFPHDRVMVADAHQYLLDHYKEFDFIWSSPPCPTHSKIRNEALVGAGRADVVYPDMTLYQEIILLQHYAPGLYCVENVIPYYQPLIPAQKVGGHMFWANFTITKMARPDSVALLDSGVANLANDLGLDISGLKMGTYKKRQTLRNCVHPLLGKHILDCVMGNQAQPVLIEYKQEALIEP